MIVSDMIERGRKSGTGWAKDLDPEIDKVYIFDATFYNKRKKSVLIKINSWDIKVPEVHKKKQSGVTSGT